MTPATRETVLFWCQVGLYITGMVFLCGILFLFWFVMTSQMQTMEVDRARDRAMLQQHHEAMQDHRAQMERLAR